MLGFKPRTADKLHYFPEMNPSKGHTSISDKYSPIYDLDLF